MAAGVRRATPPRRPVRPSPRESRTVFVDRTGRRRRLTRLVGLGIAGGLAATLGLLGLALSGASSGPAPHFPDAARLGSPSPATTRTPVPSPVPGPAGPGDAGAPPSPSASPTPTATASPSATRRGRAPTAPPGNPKTKKPHS